MQNLKIGWNLGNTLDSHVEGFSSDDVGDYEMLWGNPATTKELMRFLKASGFGSVRIPVTWESHMDENHSVNEAWMDRVAEIVDYAYNEGLYVIINAHHDRWYTPSEENEEHAKSVMQILWKQIALRFADYDERLLFESMNEPRLIGTEHEWTTGTAESRRIVNELNEVFVKTVRDCGGNNIARYLILPTYCADDEVESIAAFRPPEGEKRLIASIHLYSPFSFASPAHERNTWHHTIPEDVAPINRTLQALDEHLIQKGIPVIIGEFGAADKGNLEARISWCQYVTEKARESGIVCFWWDPGGTPDQPTAFSIVDRYTLSIRHPEIHHVLMNATIPPQLSFHFE